MFWREKNGLTLSEINKLFYLPFEQDEDNEDDWEDDSDTAGDEINDNDDVIMNDDDDDEWETSSETSDVNIELTNQMSPLEDIIRRSLDALSPSSADNNTVNPINVQATDESSMQVSDRGDHVIGMNQRTVEFMTALERQFKPDEEESGENTGTEQMETHTEGGLYFFYTFSWANQI